VGAAIVGDVEELGFELGFEPAGEGEGEEEAEGGEGEKAQVHHF